MPTCFYETPHRANETQEGVGRERSQATGWESPFFAPSLSPQMLRTGPDSASETSHWCPFSQSSLSWYKTFITSLPGSPQASPCLLMTYTSWCEVVLKYEMDYILPSSSTRPMVKVSYLARKKVHPLPGLLPTSPSPSPLLCTQMQGSENSRLFVPTPPHLPANTAAPWLPPSLDATSIWQAHSSCQVLVGSTITPFWRLQGLGGKFNQVAFLSEVAICTGRHF